MKIALFALFAWQATAATEPETTSAPPLRTSTFTVEVPQYSFPQSMLPMVAEYSGCVHVTSQPAGAKGGWVAATRANIESCAGLRKAAIKRSVAAVRSDPDTDIKSKADVAAIFDKIDQSELANADFSDKLANGEVPYPTDGETVVLTPEKE